MNTVTGPWAYSHMVVNCEHCGHESNITLWANCEVTATSRLTFVADPNPMPRRFHLFRSPR